MVKNRRGIVNLLKDLKNHLKSRYKVKKIWAFGSVVRGEHVKTSDIDILVDFEKGADFLDLVALALFLEEKLNKKVDVVPRESLRKEIKEAVLKEVVPV